MSQGAAQKKEIKTIKERKIIVRLSDADCDRLMERCGRYNLSVNELIENFIGDLVGGTYSNGSAERAVANEWFERCWFSIQPPQTLLDHLLGLGYEPEDYLDLLNEIKEAQKERRYVIKHPEEYDSPEEEKRYLKELVEDLQEALTEMRDEWKPVGRINMSEEIKRIRKWKEEKEILLNGNMK